MVTVTPPGADADRVANAVSSMPTIAALSGGPSGGVGTYLPGRVVLGVRVTGQKVEVHVTARYGCRLTDVAEAVRAAAVPAAGGRPVDVVIEDLS
jgi:hypothetical protein